MISFDYPNNLLKRMRIWIIALKLKILFVSNSRICFQSLIYESCFLSYNKERKAVVVAH